MPVGTRSPPRLAMEEEGELEPESKVSDGITVSAFVFKPKRSAKGTMERIL